MRYFIRSAKYFVALCVLCTVLLLLMTATGTSPLTWEETLYVMFHTTRYLTLFVSIIVLALLYPRFGFVERRIEGDIEMHRTQIENAFRSAGFRLCGEEEGELLFRASTLPHRLMLLFEDEIRVSQYGQWIVLEGIRRGVARVEYRLDSYLQMIRHDEHE